MEKSNINNTYNTITHWNNFKFKLVLEGIVVGAISGLLVVLYRYLIGLAEHLSKKIYILQQENNWMILLWLITLILLGYMVGILVKREPMISGSGIPQVEGLLLRYFNMNWWYNINRSRTFSWQRRTIYSDRCSYSKRIL